MFHEGIKYDACFRILYLLNKGNYSPEESFLRPTKGNKLLNYYSQKDLIYELILDKVTM